MGVAKQQQWFVLKKLGITHGNGTVQLAVGKEGASDLEPGELRSYKEWCHQMARFKPALLDNQVLPSVKGSNLFVIGRRASA